MSNVTVVCLVIMFFWQELLKITTWMPELKDQTMNKIKSKIFGTKTNRTFILLLVYTGGMKPRNHNWMKDFLQIQFKSVSAIHFPRCNYSVGISHSFRATRAISMHSYLADGIFVFYILVRVYHFLIILYFVFECVSVRALTPRKYILYKKIF